MRGRRAIGQFAALIAALIGYYLPFVTHKTAALTMGGWDLAEFVGISPSVRYATPPMVAPGLLRAALIVLTVLFGLYAWRVRGVWRWFSALIALGLALTFIPPIEFFRGVTEDPNYRQLGAFGIVCIGLLGTVSIVNMVRVARRAPAPDWLGLVVALVGVALCWVGVAEARAVIMSPILRVEVGWGVGPMVYSLGVLIGGGLGLRTA